MEEFKAILQEAKDELDRSDDASYNRPVDNDLYHLREAVRHLIACMEHMSV